MTNLKGERWAPWVLVVVLITAALLFFSAIPMDQASAQPGPFSTLVPQSATLTPPVGGQIAQQPQLAPMTQASGPLTGKFQVTTTGIAYAAAGGFAILGSVAVYLLSRRSGAGASMGGVGGPMSAPRGFSFGGRFRPLRWLAPLGGGLVLFALAFAGCVETGNVPCFVYIDNVPIQVKCDVRGPEDPWWSEGLSEQDLDCYDLSSGYVNPSDFVPTEPDSYFIDSLGDVRTVDTGRLQAELDNLQSTIEFNENVRDSLNSLYAGLGDTVTREEQLATAKSICNDLGQARKQAKIITTVLSGRGFPIAP